MYQSRILVWQILRNHYIPQQQVFFERIILNRIMSTCNLPQGCCTTTTTQCHPLNQLYPVATNRIDPFNLFHYTVPPDRFLPFVFPRFTIPLRARSFILRNRSFIVYFHHSTRYFIESINLLRPAHLYTNSARLDIV